MLCVYNNHHQNIEHLQPIKQGDGPMGIRLELIQCALGYIRRQPGVSERSKNEIDL